MGKQIIAATAAAQKTKISCPSFETAKQEIERIMRDQHLTFRGAIAFAKRAVALCYYTQNKVSLGYCAQIADMTKDAFIRYLGANGVSIFQYDDEQEFIEEMNNA